MAPDFLLASLKRPKAGGIRYHKDARSALNRAQWSYVWGPPGGGGWGGPHSIGPRQAVLDAAKGGCWFFSGLSLTHMIISCRDMVGSHR